MADFNSSLPVRTENAGDVASKIVDATTPSQGLVVNVDGSINITDNAGSITVDGTVELGSTTLAALESITVQNGSGGAAVNIQDGGNSITVDGTVELGATTLAALESITVAGTVELGSTTLAALESITVQNGSGASAVNIQDGGNSITVDGTVELGATTLAALETITVVATDLDIRNLSHSQDSVKIGDGTDFLEVNTDGSINVKILDVTPGTQVNDFKAAAAIAGGSSDNHDYTVTALKTMYLKQIECAGSGKAKMEVKIETGVATGVYTTKFVQFNSTSSPNMAIHLEEEIAVAAGVKVRVTMTNRDNQSQDLYSTICGHEV